MRNRNSEFTPRSRMKFDGRQGGAALVVGLLVTTVMSLVAVNASKQTVVQQRMATNYRFSIEAMNNADSGSLTAFNQINAQGLILNGFNDELDLNGNGELDDRYSITLADPDNNMFFDVIIVDDNDGDGNPSFDSNGVVLLVSQGISDVGSTRTTELRIGDTTGEQVAPVDLDKAILTEDSLNIIGNPTQSGSHQDIHSNSDVTIGGSPESDGTISAVGEIDIAGGAAEVNTVSGAAHVDIPHVDPRAYAPYADFIFESNGEIYDSGGLLVGDGSVGRWNGWSLGGDVWTLAGNRSIDGMLYFRGERGNVRVLGNPGTAGSPWEVSILADGYISIEGTPIIQNHMDPDDPPAVQAILFLASGDIKIKGNASQTFAGVIAAGEQIDVSGNAKIEGSLIAADLSHDSQLVSSNSISGDMEISYDGGLSLISDAELGDGIAVILSWRDREIARNSGVFAIN